MEINGIAHVFITTGDFDRSRAFYRQLLPFLGLREAIDGPNAYYCYGARAGIGLRPPAPEHQGQRFEQNRPGLHHICFRARRREDVEEVHAFLLSIGALIVHPPRDDDFAAGYYSVLFEDPDGIRLEVNHVPSAAVVTPGDAGHLGPVSS
ncbi:MAG: VOC family protein [Caulobacteraceae bacterium]|nr:VOC family protein [Caulobacteraceae bacterium]